MSDSVPPFTITFPFDENTGTVFFALLMVLTLSFAVYGILQMPALEKSSRDWKQQGIEILFVFLIPVWICLMAFVIWTLISLAASFPDASDGDDLRWHALALVGMMTSLAGLIGTPFVFLRAQTTERHTVATEQGLITDRISKAVEQIGAEKTVKKDGEESTHPNIEVRIGGLYALERIAQDSPRDHIQIMEILCAYVRENSPAEQLIPFDGNYRQFEDQKLQTRLDIQVVIDILGRRTTSQINKEWQAKFRLNLNQANLSNISFKGGNFSAANLQGCNLEGTIFHTAILHGTMMHGSLLNHALFIAADLTGTRLDQAVLTQTSCMIGELHSSLNMAVTLRGVSLAGSYFPAEEYFGNPQDTNQIFGTSETVLGTPLQETLAQAKSLMIELKRHKENGPQSDHGVLISELKQVGFFHWDLDKSENWSSVDEHSRFLEVMGLTGFPYE